MCNLYSITTNQAAIAALFRVVNRYVGNLPPMPGVFPDYPAPVIRNTATGRELAMMRWGMPPPPRTPGPPVTNIRNTSSPHWRLAEARKPLPGPCQQFCRICARAQSGDQEEGRGVVRPRR
jgi:putative SOS response-associated peptidase YedK